MLRAMVPRTLGQSSDGQSKKAQAEATHGHRQDSHSGLQSLKQRPEPSRDLRQAGLFAVTSASLLNENS